MGRIPPWADLPQELLATIVNCLYSNPIDVQSFRSVCKSWRTSSLSPATSPFTLFPPLPLTTPAPPYLICNRCNLLQCSLTIISATVVYLLRPPVEAELSSCNPRVWFLFVDQSIPGKVSIRKPLSNKSFSMPINFPRNLNLLGFHASEVCRFHNLTPLSKEGAKLTKLLLWSGMVRKVVLFSNCYGLSVVTLSEDGKLGLLRLGLGDNYENLDTEAQWEIIHDGKGYRFDDIVDFKGRVLGIDRRGRVYEIEIGYSSPVIIKAIVAPIAGGGGRRKRFVESLGRLHLVVRGNVRQETDVMFKVYEINEDAKKWVEVKSLGNQTFFLGLDFSFSVSAEELHGSFEKNCILFRQRSFFNYNGSDEDYALFKKVDSDDLHIGVWHLGDAGRLEVIGSHPGYSDVLWPPPHWIWPIDKSERVETLLNALDQLQMRFPNEKLKEKLNDLSPHQHEGALYFMKLTLKIKELQIRVRGIEKMLKQLEMIVTLLQEKSQSVNQHNQAEASTLGTKERRVSVDSLQKVTKELNLDFDWHSIEMNFSFCIFDCEEKASQLVDTLKLGDFSAYTDG